MIGAFQVFDIAYILGGSRGGSRGSLLFYLLNLWNEGFRNGRLGYASALAWVLVSGRGHRHRPDPPDLRPLGLLRVAARDASSALRAAGSATASPTRC